MFGDNCVVDPRALIGISGAPGSQPTIIGSNAIIRAFTVIHAGVVAGSHLRTGHFVLIRDPTWLGDFVVVGTGTTIDGEVRIGSKVKIESHVYIPTHTTIGDRVFIGPGAVLTNDRYPLRQRYRYQPKGPVLENDVTVGARAVILPGVQIGQGSFIGAGAVVTKDVAPWSLAAGNPARSVPLPEHLREENRALKW
jgi:acetyltransferase-like isoleucine patch superfamily enzyme